MINRLIKFYRRRFWSAEKYARSIGVQIGENCVISSRNFSSEPYLIKIGNNVRIANDVKFFTHGGLIPFRDILGENIDQFGKVTIGNRVHIGDGVYIMPGVNIGDNVIIGAGTVVTRSIPNNVIVAGNPGRIVGDIDAFFDKVKDLNVGTKQMSYKEKKEYLLSLPDDKFIKK